MSVVVASAITNVPKISILGLVVCMFPGNPITKKPLATNISGIVPQYNPRQPNTLSANTPPNTGPISAATPVGKLSNPVHFARSADGKRSPITVKQSGMIGKCPMLIKVVAATRKAIVVVLAEMPRPTRNIPMDSNRITRRPYMSESLPNSNVDTEPLSAGRAISHEKSAMPSSSAIIPGWAIFLALMKRKLTNCVMKTAVTPIATFRLIGRSCCEGRASVFDIINCGQQLDAVHKVLPDM